MKGKEREGGWVEKRKTNGQKVWRVWVTWWVGQCGPAPKLKLVLLETRWHIQISCFIQLSVYNSNFHTCIFIFILEKLEAVKYLVPGLKNERFVNYQNSWQLIFSELTKCFNWVKWNYLILLDLLCPSRSATSNGLSVSLSSFSSPFQSCRQKPL